MGVHRESRWVKPPACRWCRRARLIRPAASGADHGDRVGAQQRFQAGHVGGPATGLDGREVGVVLVERDGAAHLRTLEAASDTQAQVGEEPQHLVVLLAERVGGERGDTVRTRGGDEVFDEEGTDAPAA